MQQFLEIAVIGSFGAAAMEFLKFREMYGRLPAEQFDRLWKSTMFWVLSLGFIVFAGVFTWVVHRGSNEFNALAATLTGSGFRTFGREGLGAMVHNQKIMQGDQSAANKRRLELRDLLQ